MKTVYLKGLRRVVVEEVAKPELKEGEVLVKVKAGGICGTDMHIFSKENSFSHPLGHELTGYVVENNSDYDHIKEGDRVVIDNATNCGVCRFCKNGQPEYCINILNLLLEEKIGFQEYVAVPARCVYPFSGLTYQEAALAEPLTVALEMLETAEVKKNQDIAIFGPGPIGLMAAQVAKHIGVKSIYMTGHSHSISRLGLAKKIGVTGIIEVDKESTVNYFRNKGIELDRVLITAPPSTINEAIPILRFGGILTYIGFDFNGAELVKIDFNQVHFKKLQIRATHAIPNRFYPEALALLKEGVVKAEDYISDVFKVDDIQEAFEHSLKGDTIKTMIVFD